MQTSVRKALGNGQLITHAKATVWHSASAFAKAVAPRKTIIFALQKSSKHLSLLVAFRQTQFQIKPLLSAKTLPPIFDTHL